MDRLHRTRLLFGNDTVAQLRKSTVMVVGCGAVGSFAIEALARTGIGHLILIDSDSVEESNINRQLFALGSTVGMPKVAVASARIHDINPEIQVDALNLFFDEKTEEITMAEGLGSGPDPMGAYYYCGGLHNINEAYTYLDYQFEEPDFPVPVQRSDDIFESSDGYYGYWLQGMYAVYSDGALTTDFIYEECGSESNGVLAAKKDGKWGYIAADGTEVIPFEYDSSWQIFSGDEEISYCYAASEGYIPLVKDGMWEMRDTAGNVVIPAGVFEAIRPVNEGKCWVQKNGKWGVIQLETGDVRTDEPEDGADGEADQEPRTEAKSEEELRAVLEENISDLIVNFEYDDYDGDGVSEAFGITSPEDYDELGLCGDVGVWFIDCEGNCTQLMSDTYGYLHQQKVTAGLQKFIVWEMSGGGSGSLSYIFGIRDGSPYEPLISGQYMQFETAKYDDAVYVGQTSDFSMGYHNYIITEFVFDSDSGEFIEM